MPALFSIIIILITMICLICCIRRRRRNSSYAKLSDELHTTTALVSPTTYATTIATTATSSEPAKEPYNSAAVIQVGDSKQPSTANDPPMLQPMLYPVTENLWSN